MSVKRLAVPVVFCLCSTLIGSDDGDSVLHPLDGFTANTLDKNEWVFNFPLTPGWLMWGVTDDITVELDAECWLGGVPSVNARFGLCDQNGVVPALALETMYQYLPDTINLLETFAYLNVRRQGSSLWGRVNMSWALSERVGLHISPGVTWSEELQIDNGDRAEFISYSEDDLVEADFSVGVSWVTADWLSVYGTASSGVTFAYLDNVPSKRQVTGGVRVKPFQGMSSGILRNMGVELGIVSMNFPEVEETLTGPMLYLYWQWKCD